MASGLNPILTLQGKVNASNALVVTASAATAGTAGTIGTVRGPIASLQGKTESDALVVRING